MTKIDEMIIAFRTGENLLLESRTEMIDHSLKDRKDFYIRGIKAKEKGRKLYNWLVKKIGIDEEYLYELLTGEGI